jgi:hypothetical protein
VILLVTLVILVILAALGYTLTARVAARRHRDQYVIDYCQARYACASALKSAIASIPTLEPQLISRPNEPDFSDTFAMSELEYQQFLAQYAADLALTDNNAASNADGNNVGDTKSKSNADKKRNTSKKKGAKETDGISKADVMKKSKQTDRNKQSDKDQKAAKLKKVRKLRDANDVNDLNDVNDVNDLDASETALPSVSGPYGPPWPLVTQPVECEIGSAKVKIEIEDENAKYPLGWALIADEPWKTVADVSFVTFCEWMGYDKNEINGMRGELAKINEVRPFKLAYKAQAPTPQPPASLRSKATSIRPDTRRTVPKKVTPPVDPMEQQNIDYGKLFHSAMIDADLLRRPSIVSDTRNESAMKYLGLWATRQVNVNSAPRHVLEALFTFGSVADAPKIAAEVIRLRQLTPFTNVEEVKKGVLQYSDSIDKCKELMTTTSTTFTIRITATSGVAKVTVLAAVSKEGDKVKQIGIVSD